MCGGRPVLPWTPILGRTPRAVSLWCGCGVECTPRWVGASDLHGTECQTLGDLEIVCNDDEAVLSGFLIKPV